MLLTFLIRSLGSISKWFCVEHNFIISLGLDSEFSTLYAPVQIGWNVAFGVLRCLVELSYAGLGSIFPILKPFQCDAVLSIDLGCSICHNLLLTSLACNLHYSSLEVFLVMGFLWVVPVVASVAVNFSDYLNHHGVVGVGVVRSWWWWRSVIVWGWWRILLWWGWRSVVIWWMR